MKINLPKKQIEDIGRFYDFVKSPAGVIETFFISPTGKKATRYYDDRDQFAQDVVLYNHHGFAPYG